MSFSLFNQSFITKHKSKQSDKQNVGPYDLLHFKECLYSMHYKFNHLGLRMPINKKQRSLYDEIYDYYNIIEPLLICGCCDEHYICVLYKMIDKYYNM